MSISVDLSGIDLAALIEHETGTVRFGKWYGYGEKRTCKGRCPWCPDSTNRFAVLDSDPQHFYCGIHGGPGCHKRGHAVDFMMLWHNIKFMEACRRLNVTPKMDGEDLKPEHTAKVYANIDRVPVEAWRLSGEYFIRLCEACLWHETKGKVARDTLRERGFTDDEIRLQRYGYNLTTVFDRDTSRWGITDEEVKAIRLPRGLVIPYFVGSDLWKINIRRPRVDIQNEEKRTGQPASKYVNIKGGSNPIYHADSIKPGRPLVMFEGEYNADILAMVLRQADITDIGVIATGSTGKGRSDNWLAKIAKASPILISFDPDGAGVQAVKDYWQKVLPNALFWPSRGGDLNDMYLAGGSDAILKWLKKGLKIAGSEITPVIESSPSPIQEPPPADVSELSGLACKDCDTAIEALDRDFFVVDDGSPDGLWYCDVCRDPEQPEVKRIPDVNIINIVEQPATLTPEQVQSRFLAAFRGRAEIVPAGFFGSLKERIESHDPTLIPLSLDAARSRKEQSRRIDFTVQPDWTSYGSVWCEAEMLDKNGKVIVVPCRGHWMLDYNCSKIKGQWVNTVGFEQVIGGKWRKELDPVDRLSHWSPPADHQSCTSLGDNMMDAMRALDAENEAKRAARGIDLTPLIPARDEVLI